MSFKVHEQNGSWTVVQETPDMHLVGGLPISYELYQQLRANPHEAANHFERVDGKLVKKQPKAQ